MSQLVPCPSCFRHVRLTGDGCPFCAAPLQVDVLRARHAARTLSVQVGLKRAAVFAFGASVAAACGGRTAGEGGSEPVPTLEPSTSSTTGVPVAPATTTTVAPTSTWGTATGPTGATGSTGVGVPIYGAPFPTDPYPTTTTVAPSTTFPIDPTTTTWTIEPTTEVTWGQESTTAPEPGGSTGSEDTLAEPVTSGGGISQPPLDPSSDTMDTSAGSGSTEPAISEDEIIVDAGADGSL